MLSRPIPVIRAVFLSTEVLVSQLLGCFFLLGCKRNREEGTVTAVLFQGYFSFLVIASVFCVEQKCVLRWTMK